MRNRCFSQKGGRQGPNRTHSHRALVSCVTMWYTNDPLQNIALLSPFKLTVIIEYRFHIGMSPLYFRGLLHYLIQIHPLNILETHCESAFHQSLKAGVTLYKLQECLLNTDDRQRYPYWWPALTQPCAGVQPPGLRGQTTRPQHRETAPRLWTLHP